MDARCIPCADSFQGINGLYCMWLKRYVEHDTERPCNKPVIKMINRNL